MISFILNLPYTLVGLLVGIVSFPGGVKFKTSPYVIILKVKSFWWAIGYMKGARAVVIGHVVLLSRKVESRDLEHELVHVRQYERLPIIFPILYYVELIRKGYRRNKYEEEAYKLSGNKYYGK